MSRFLTVSLGLLFLAALIDTNAASAAFVLTTNSCFGSGVVVLCDESSALEGTEEAIGHIVPGTETLVAAKVGTTELHVECTAIDWTSKVTSRPLVAELTSTLTVVFSGCSLLEPLAKKCSVPAEMRTSKLVGTSNETSAVTLAPESGTTFIEIEVSNGFGETCPATIKGKRKITGTQQCVNISPGTLATEKETECTEAGSSLTLSESPVEFKAFTDIHLSVFTPWFYGLA
ncbi:MAG TPA: hypothetical protein VK761_07400 [Solirubrobacteraceae bacterium]|jgi:hypothetical protein|nr:hypothetical protein [Solirubrobacteraceae bacterium]